MNRLIENTLKAPFSDPYRRPFRMDKFFLVSYLIAIFLVMSHPLFAEDIIEPELIATVNHSLSSDPQEGVDYHVIKVCKDYEMTEDCKQCIYDASEDGSLNIPTYNNCVIRSEQDPAYANRTSDDEYHKYFYQFKAGSNEGPESEWTDPKIVSIMSLFNNNPTYSYAYLFVQYDHD